MTSNGEREFPPPFLRRCVRLTLQDPDSEKLARIVDAHLRKHTVTQTARDQQQLLIENFLQRRTAEELATDQLLNALYLRLQGAPLDSEEGRRLLETLLKPLSGGEAT